jgi:hypothetical protein
VSATHDEKTSEFSIAAIVYSEHGVADNLLAEFALGLRREGWHVQGLVQQKKDGHGKAATMLIDLETEKCYPLFPNPPSNPDSCSLDPGSIADASIALRRALETRADLAIANHFGALEADGKGLIAEMLALMTGGIPLLTAVPSDYLMDWRSFSGHASVELPPEMGALREWFASIMTGNSPLRK